ncbi:MAG: FAD-dependent oxidoreductase [Alphaproteobacteria bacterium]|jgi:hypothetical protein|nr:FAD-dependent oxidoreductase [Alphaproteobacteria bacterium]
MKTITEPARETPLCDDYDVIVAGGGTAGIVAAVAARRQGARVLLVERGGFLGGTIAVQLLEHSEGWFDAQGTRIVAGYPEELVERLGEAGASPGHVRDDTGYTRYRVPVNHEEFKSLVTAWVAEAGVAILLNSPVVAVAEAARGHHLIVENKSGRIAYAAPQVVDCTGDADVAAQAGCAFLSEPGRETQPVSLLFKLGGIDHEALIDHVEAHPEDFKIGVDAADLRGETHVNLWGFGSLLARAHQAGVLSLKRNELHYSGWTQTGEAAINLTRHAADATRSEDLAAAEVVLRRQILEGVAFFRAFVPGCERAHLSATAASIGVRESRRLAGAYVLRDDDVRAGRRFPDAIARGGFPIDSHDAKGASMAASEALPAGYDIPLRCLLPETVDDLVVAGRCISAERRALASARITGTCMAMGQAAGTAAALAAAAGTSPRALDVDALRQTLKAAGAIL